jgi:L-alanine-DL-glutamate epimerase-like enolase superfamily enzyme
MKITDVRCAVIGSHPIVRIITDEGIVGHGQAESWKPFIKPQVLHLREALIGQDPTTVERVMLRIRQHGGLKPWGAAVSIVEMALWDIAGKAAGLPVHKLLGGKVRDKVRVYNGGIRFPIEEFTPEAFAEDTRRTLASPEGFTIIKQPIAFHGPMKRGVKDFHLGTNKTVPLHGIMDTGIISKRGYGLMLDCVAAMVEVCGDVGLALDCGPGFTVSDAIRFARDVEPHNLMWLEDLIDGDYTPYANADVYREVTRTTMTRIHTGEQLYLRQNFKAIIEGHAVNVIGPDPADVGGLAELKWIAEYANLHGILMAPHGAANGIIGLAALSQVCATMPDNLIAFEYPAGFDPFWNDIVEGLEAPLCKDGFVTVSERPGLGADFRIEQAKRHLAEQDVGFFD